MWHLQLPAKIKIFTRKCFHDFLPTFGNLRARHVDCSEDNRRCREGKESTLHALVQCASVAEVWGASSFATGVMKFKGDSFKKFLLFMKAQVSKEDFMVFLAPSLETVVRKEQVYP